MKQPTIRGRFASMPLRERFEEKVSPEPNTGCWLWVGACDRAGYGSLGVNGRVESAHRVSYMLNVAPIPTGMHVRHRCDTPACVRPEHLELGTHRDNMRDKVLRGRCAVRLGLKNHASKLTPGMAAAIRRLYSAGGISQQRIANALDISQESVSAVIRRDTWRHVL